jgi:Flp pilus assembly pilin Flp
MRSSSPEKKRRQQSRVSAVLPGRVRGTDSDGKPFEEVAHTLDITATGARLAAIRRPLKVMDQLVVVYRQRRIAFLIVWTKLVGKHEYQVGLQAVGEHGLGIKFVRLQIRCLEAGSLTASSSEANEEDFIRSFPDSPWRDTEGQDVAEYAIMLAVVLVIVVGMVRMIGANASTVFSQVGSAIQ